VGGEPEHLSLAEEVDNLEALGLDPEEDVFAQSVEQQQPILLESLVTIQSAQSVGL